MRGDPLALEENLHRPGAQPHLDLGAGEAMGNAVIMVGDIDVIVNADAPRAPFAQNIRGVWQKPQRRPVDLFEKLTARYAQPADWAFFVEALEKTSDRRVDLGEAIKNVVAHSSQEPTFDDENRLFDFGFVPRASGPGRQNGRSVMGRHVSI